MDVKPKSPWLKGDELRKMVAPNFALRERLPIYPQYIEKGWYSEELKPLIAWYADENGLRRKERF